MNIYIMWNQWLLIQNVIKYYLRILFFQAKTASDFFMLLLLIVIYRMVPEVWIWTHYHLTDYILCTFNYLHSVCMNNKFWMSTESFKSMNHVSDSSGFIGAVWYSWWTTTAFMCKQSFRVDINWKVTLF